MDRVDVVVVAFNSARTIRGCVQPLADTDWIDVFVVDNGSDDAGLDAVGDLRVTGLAIGRNLGFAAGCNRAWRLGTAPYVLFLNPDARVDADSLRRLMSVLAANPAVGLVAPRIDDGDGALDYSQRRFSRLRSTYAQALFLHRLWPLASWADEVIRDPTAYERQGSAEWVSGACMLVRRRALEELAGWDEGFFLYGEDQDLCRRLWAAGYEIRFEPSARAVHEGGASAPRSELLPLLADSRIRYARKHRGRVAATIERLGIGLGALTHALLTTKGGRWRRSHLRALHRVLQLERATSSPSASTTLSE
jgi:N-acetylglucosaminyl-diphospho-decaprenol L-rhamnosyltransferase